MVHAQDATSPIDKLEYSIGGGTWQLVAPVDERRRFWPTSATTLPSLGEADLARLVVRVTDVMQNVATQPAPVRDRPGQP